jgi:phenylalanyl-tRNA synthetase beta chain
MPSKGVPGALHPGQTALITLNGEAVGWLGHLHPLWQQKYDLTEPTFIFEFCLDALQKRGLNDIELPSKLIPVRRDIAVIIDQGVPVQDMVRAVYGAKIGRLIEFVPFDVYQGQGIDKNKKSIAFLILMQDTYKTLEDSDVTKIVDQVLEILQSKFSATLR